MAHVGHKLVLTLAGNLEIFDSLGKFTRSRLDFFEQASILYCEYSLVREGVDELDLAFGERAHFAAMD